MGQNNVFMISEWILNVVTRRPRKRLDKAIQRVLRRIGEDADTGYCARTIFGLSNALPLIRFVRLVAFEGCLQWFPHT